MEIIATMAEAVRDRQRFLLCLHRSPDGDSVGSSLAMSHALTDMGKSATVASTDPVPRAYQFLKGADRIVDPGSVSGSFDAAIIIDCGSIDRTGRARALVEACPLVLNIDHHETNSLFGHLNWVDPESASAGQMILDLLDEMDIQPGEDAAAALYTALATDTGFFAFPSTSASVLRTAARLVELGADPGTVSASVQENRRLASIKILAQALLSLTIEASGRVAWMELSRDDIVAAGAVSEDIDGIVNYARAVAGVEVGLLFVEQEGPQVKVGLRSRALDVARVAGCLGGGGHARASGCLVRGSLEEARERVLRLIAEALEGGV